MSNYLANNKITNKETGPVHSNREFHDIDNVFYNSKRYIELKVLFDVKVSFEPNLFRKTIWILIFTIAEVLLAKGT